MNEQFKKLPLRVLVLISSPRLAERAGRLLAESRVPIHYQLRGQGTVSGEMMDLFGLGSVTKSISVSLMPKPYAAKMMARLEAELGLGRPNTGVAFTTAVTGISTPAMKLLDENIRKELQDSMENETRQMAAASTRSLIVAVVNQGYSEEVMDAARQAGARGGTTLHARQLGGEEAMHFWGITVQPEKELVLILADAGQKLGIMRAIGERCGMQSEARGIVFSSPIDAIAGLNGGG